MKLTAKDIAQQLASRADSFAPSLLPNGHKESGNWCVGSPAGEPGSSMRIQITGPNAGVWADFAGNDRGDMLDLIVSVKQVTMAEAIQFAKSWLGIRDPESVLPKKTYTKPKTVLRPVESARQAVRDYLMDVRQIDGLTINQFRIAEFMGKNGPEIVFPSYSPAGDLVNLKYLAVQRTPEGKKIIRQEGGCAPSLFGWQAVEGSPREIVISEGEIDAMTWTAMGFPCLSVPDGAEGESWIDYEWNNLEQFDRIYLAWDNDAPGQKGAAKIAKRLGLHRCYVVKLAGCKDANEALQAGMSETAFQTAIADAKTIDPEQIKAPIAFRDKVQEKFYPPSGVQPGFQSQLFGDQICFRPAELTVWTGISSHGKSAILNQLVLETILRGRKAAIASMEMPGYQTLHRMLCQSSQSTRPRPEDIDGMLEWLSGILWIYDLMGNVSPKTVLELMEYSFSRHGVDTFVIDSLMKLAVDSEDYNAQRVVLNDLCSFVKDTNTHIHLVAHARKGRDELSAPGKLDVKGSSDITNQPDNVLTVWRNKEKELKDSGNGTLPDTIVYCNKQRETGLEFKSGLKFYSGIFRFSAMGQEMQNLNILDYLEPQPTVASSAPPASEPFIAPPDQSELPESNDP